MDESTPSSRHSDSLGQTFLWALIQTLLLVLTPPNGTYAQIVTNITPTQTAPLDLGTDVNTVGTTTEITGGTRPNNGTNLFHSFDFFTLGTGDTAHFLNDMQLPTDNIFGRVIGGEVSTIDGTLLTNNPLDATDPMNFGAANLWLVNPSGVFLGPNARIEVGGSVSMSTANYLRFEGTSTLFDMLSSPASLGPLSVAPVAAFGFLGPDLPAPITVQGSMLQVPEGQALSLVGGEITVQAHMFEDGTSQAANLRAPGGQLNLVSVASPGEVLVPHFQTGSFATMGTVTLKEGALLDVSGQFDEFGTPLGNGNSGTVLVRGGQLVMDTSMILANTLANIDGAPTAVDVAVSQDVILANGAIISTVTALGLGRGGDVRIAADTLLIENFSEINTDTIAGGGVGGDLFLNVGTLTLEGGDSGGSTIRTSNGSGADLDGDGVLDIVGVGGNVTIRGIDGSGSTADSLELSGGSRIAITSDFGDGGQLSIAAKSLSLDGTDLNGISTTINSTAFGFGHGGSIVVSVGDASLSGGATITSSSFVDLPPDHPDPTAGAGGSVTVQGLNGDGSKADLLDLAGFRSGIISDAVGNARPGDIAVYAKTLSLTDGAVIEGGDPVGSNGTGGIVAIEADSVGIIGGSHISSQARAQDAGRVTITAERLTLDNGSIETSSASEVGGRAGDVMLTVGTVSLLNGATINSSASQTGLAADINILASGSVTMTKGSTISASSTGTANAGNITINTGDQFAMTNSSVTTEATEASGGQIEINAPEMVRLTNSRISTSVKGVAGDSDGGNITIDPQFVILQNSQFVAQANAGAGGAINVIAGVFIADPNSLVSASSQGGPQGTVNIQSPVQNVGEQLTPLSEQFSSAAALLAQQCAARAVDGKFSTFSVSAREGLPVEPGGFLASPSWMAERFGSSLSERSPHIQLAAVTGMFPKHDTKPIQLAKYGGACR